MRRVLHVVGARPNFMKAAPVVAAMARRPERFEQLLVHTGQHYDENLSEVFLRELGLPRPDAHLGAGSGSHAEHTAKVMIGIEKLVLERRPDLVVVVGDVNSTLATALVCAKLGVSVAHVEAGLRSFDWRMPEEVNRVVTDRLSRFLFTTEASAARNLAAEGIAAERVHFVGNVMIDTLVHSLERAGRSDVLSRLGVEPGAFAVATLHRPSNVDDPGRLAAVLDGLEALAARMPVIFPVHPRTRDRMAAIGRCSSGAGLRLVEPLSYLDFLRLYASSRIVLTDSGGLQEETTFLGIPCLTLRENTERPVTIELGTNRLVASRRDAIEEAFEAALTAPPRAHRAPPLWDGRSAERIVSVLEAA